MMYAELKRIVCPKCGTEKEVGFFGKDSTNQRGISCWCKLCKKEWRAQHRKDNPEKHKSIDFKNDLKKHYNMSVEDYNSLYDRQNGSCACCGANSTEFRRGLHVDHDHITGKIRGLLCTKCNPGLGYFDDSIKKLQLAVAYLEKFKKLE